MHTAPSGPFRSRRSPLVLVRVVVSIAALLLLVAGSAPVSGFLERAAAIPVRAQLIPAMLRLAGLATAGTGVALFVFPLIIALTAVVGRGYCSSLCPLGTLQDGALRLSRALRTVRLRFRAPHGLLRATALALVAAGWIAGSTIPLALVEPYSVFSRVISFASGRDAAPRPPLSTPDNPQAADTAANAPRVAPFVLSAILLLLVLAAAARKGRFFCNTLCPAGALLSLPGRYSVLRIHMSSERCTACGLCERACPARCIDVKATRVYTGSCVLCFSCLDACPSGALWYGARSEAP